MKLIIAVIATGIMSFLGVTVETAMNVTFPTLQEEFGVGVDQVHWVTTGYLLVLGIIMPASAWLKKTVPLKALFASAVILFIAGSILGGLAPTFTVLLVGRSLQAAGTGIALPLMFNIIMDQAPKKYLGTIMGVAGLITALAPAVGPSLGGFIVTRFGWRDIFWATIPILIVALIAGLWAITQTTELSRTRFDVLGWLLVALGFTGVLMGWWIVGIIALAAFVAWALKTSNPLIDLRIFKRAGFVAALAILVFMQFSTLGQGYLIVNYTQLEMGMDPFKAGLLLVPGCILGALLAPISGRILDRFGAAKPIGTGIVAVIIAMALFAIIADELSPTQYMVFYSIYTLGQGLVTGNTMTVGLGLLPKHIQPDGTATINTLQQMAGAVGTAATTGLFAASGSQVSSFSVYAVLGVAMAVAWGVLFLPGKPTQAPSR